MIRPIAAAVAATLERQPLRRGWPPRNAELRPLRVATALDAGCCGSIEEAMAQLAEFCAGPNVARRGLMRSVVET